MENTNSNIGSNVQRSMSENGNENGFTTLPFTASSRSNTNANCSNNISNNIMHLAQATNTMQNNNIGSIAQPLLTQQLSLLQNGILTGGLGLPETRPEQTAMLLPSTNQTSNTVVALLLLQQLNLIDQEIARIKLLLNQPLPPVNPGQFGIDNSNVNLPTVNNGLLVDSLAVSRPENTSTISVRQVNTDNIQLSNKVSTSTSRSTGVETTSVASSRAPHHSLSNTKRKCDDGDDDSEYQESQVSGAQSNTSEQQEIKRKSPRKTKKTRQRYSRNRKCHYPQKLFEILSNENEYGRIIRWQNDSEWIVVDRHQMETAILPKHFKHNSLKSFYRQAQKYKFIRNASSGAYSHPQFKRNQPELFQSMKVHRS